MVKPRIIGVKSCKNCKALVSSYQNQGVDFEYWDGDRDDLQDKLDNMNINDFPVVQIIDDNGKVLWTADQKIWPKGISYRKVKQQMDVLAKKGTRK